VRRLAVIGLPAAGVVAGCGGDNHKEKHAEWSYHGKTGPSHWGSLDPAYKACGSGKRQSPIS
jgi:carbonic anhydrase